MRLPLAASFCISMMLVAGSAQEVSRPPQCPPGVICDPRRFDEYGTIPSGMLSWADERARLDNVASALKEEPDTIVYLSMYGGRRGCIGEVKARATRAKNYLVRERGISSDRILWKDNGYREDFTVEVWIQPRGVVEPYPTPMLKRSEVRLRDCRRTVRRRQGRGNS
jgi:hypothetical protein